jgi:hypothetical protein
MILGTLLLALAQPAASAAATMPTCSLVTPRGDRIEFFIWGGEHPDQFNFTAVPGSAWPQHTLTGLPRNLQRNTPWFIIGRTNGVSLLLGGPPAGSTRREATLVSRNQRMATLPLAYGFCEEHPAPETAEPPSAQDAGMADISAFNPDLWPEQDCAMLLGDGRRIRFRFTMNGENEARLESEALWPGAPVTVPLSWSDPARQRHADFTTAGGPEGTQMFLVAGTLGARLVHLRRVGGGAPDGLTGYGICGHRGVRMRPNRD